VKSIRHRLTAPVAAATLIAFAACTGGFVVVDGGPPPYTPSHGYRHRHPVDHVVLVYNTDVSLYVVSGHRDCYYDGGRYYRLRGGSWYYASRINGPWVVVNYSSVPSGLHHKYKDKSHGKKQKKSKHGRGHDYD